MRPTITVIQSFVAQLELKPQKARFCYDLVVSDFPVFVNDRTLFLY